MKNSNKPKFKYKRNDIILIPKNSFKVTVAILDNNGSVSYEERFYDKDIVLRVWMREFCRTRSYFYFDSGTMFGRFLSEQDNCYKVEILDGMEVSIYSQRKVFPKQIIEKYGKSSKALTILYGKQRKY